MVHVIIDVVVVVVDANEIKNFFGRFDLSQRSLHNFHKLYVEKKLKKLKKIE
jgi:hypothetical protein